MFSNLEKRKCSPDLAHVKEILRMESKGNKKGSGKICFCMEVICYTCGVVVCKGEECNRKQAI